MTVPATRALRDDAVSIDVDITPLPSPSSTVVATTPGGTAASGGVDQGWLALTGLEPAWMLLGVGALAVILGVVVSRVRRRRP